MSTGAEQVLVCSANVAWTGGWWAALYCALGLALSRPRALSMGRGWATLVQLLARGWRDAAATRAAPLAVGTGAAGGWMLVSAGAAVWGWKEAVAGGRPQELQPPQRVVLPAWQGPSACMLSLGRPKPLQATAQVAGTQCVPLTPRLSAPRVGAAWGLSRCWGVPRPHMPGRAFYRQQLAQPWVHHLGGKRTAAALGSSSTCRRKRSSCSSRGMHLTWTRGPGACPT